MKAYMMMALLGVAHQQLGLDCVVTQTVWTSGDCTGEPKEVNLDHLRMLGDKEDYSCRMYMFGSVKLNECSVSTLDYEYYKKE